jgi:unsaturated chondroitin disaccharide hydrolase
MLLILSSDTYQSRNVNNAFLLHSTGNEPQGTEIDASIIYADYYYLEALLRVKKLQEGKSLNATL